MARLASAPTAVSALPSTSPTQRTSSGARPARPARGQASLGRNGRPAPPRSRAGRLALSSWRPVCADEVRLAAPSVVAQIVTIRHPDSRESEAHEQVPRRRIRTRCWLHRMVRRAPRCSCRRCSGLQLDSLRVVGWQAPHFCPLSTLGPMPAARCEAIVLIGTVSIRVRNTCTSRRLLARQMKGRPILSRARRTKALQDRASSGPRLRVAGMRRSTI